MNLTDVMDAVAARLNVVPQIRAHAFPVDAVTPGKGGAAAVVSLPDNIQFDQTSGRGVDRMMMPVVLLVGRVSDRSAVKRLGDFCDGSGPLSVKEILESGSYTACDEVVVTEIDFDVATVDNIDYLAAFFTLDITGPGA